jgi:transposase-like protein
MKKAYRHHSLEYKQQILNEIAAGIRSKAAICREEHLASSMVDRWQKHASEGCLRDHPTQRERELAKELDWYKKKVAEQTREIDILKKIDEFSALMRRSSSSIVTGQNSALRKDVK